jgi:hypothetical protein
VKDQAAATVTPAAAPCGFELLLPLQSGFELLLPLLQEVHTIWVMPADQSKAPPHTK